MRGFRHAVDITRGKYDNPADDAGDLNHFQALTTALSATVGIGNIAGVAIAIRLGGPGALFWMWVTAFFGMALKYVECTLALMHRKVNPDGSVSGGPMYYIEIGLGSEVQVAGHAMFAAFAAISSFGGGCMNQSNTLADQVKSQFGVPDRRHGSGVRRLVVAGDHRRDSPHRTGDVDPGAVDGLLYVGGALTDPDLQHRRDPRRLGDLIVTQAFAPEPLDRRRRGLAPDDR